MTLFESCFNEWCLSFHLWTLLYQCQGRRTKGMIHLILTCPPSQGQTHGHCRTSAETTLLQIKSCRALGPWAHCTHPAILTQVLMLPQQKAGPIYRPHTHTGCLNLTSTVRFCLWSGKSYCWVVFSPFRRSDEPRAENGQRTAGQKNILLKKLSAFNLFDTFHLLFWQQSTMLAVVPPHRAPQGTNISLDKHLEEKPGTTPLPKCSVKAFCVQPAACSSAGIESRASRLSEGPASIKPLLFSFLNVAKTNWSTSTTSAQWQLPLELVKVFSCASSEGNKAPWRSCWKHWIPAQIQLTVHFFVKSYI